MEENRERDFDAALDAALRDDELAPFATDEVTVDFLRSEVAARRDDLLADVQTRVATSGSKAAQSQSVEELEAARRRLVVRETWLVATAILTFCITGAGGSLIVTGDLTSSLIAGALGLASLGALSTSERIRRWFRSAALARVDDLLAAARDEEADALAEVVGDALRVAAGIVTGGPRYATVLGPLRAPGLAELRQGQTAVRTRAAERLETLLREMRGGSIGLAGSRGAGKTTVMREACFGQPADEGAKPRRGIVLFAPVRYDARDFLLHLASTICIELLGRGERRRVLDDLTRSDSALGRVPPLVRLGAVLLVAGGAACAYEWSGLLDGFSATEAWGLAVAGSGAALIALWAATAFLRRRRLGRSGDVERDARWLLERTKFQQTISSGWSGGLKLPVGVEGKVDSARSLAAAQLTVPEIAFELAELLTRAGLREQVVIGIDEIDKIAEEDARDFLNELKVIFGIRGCFFLVSVSEDAMSDFERRGLPFRNVFDSSLDEVVNVGFLEVEKSTELLAQRVIGLPRQFGLLAHCLGGGLPRDVIRAARDIVETVNTAKRELRLSEVAEAVIGGDLRAKVDATLHEARREMVEPETGKALSWLRSTSDPGARIDAYDRHVLQHVATSGGDESGRAQARRRLLRVTVELLAYLYYAETLLTLFDDTLDQRKLETWGTQPFEELACARQGFAVSPELAWERVTAAREKVGLDAREFPTIGERYAPAAS